MQSKFSKSDTGNWVETRGIVCRLLNDDEDSHQRFVLKLPGGDGTLLVAHNLELAERVPVGLGDRVEVRGVYEWSEFGGLVHWTHGDPMGIEDGGFIRFRRTVYA